MDFERPEWLIILPLVLLASRHWSHLAVRGWVRLLTLCAVVLLLAQPSLTRLSSTMDLWVIFDRSGSDEHVVLSSLSEWRSIIEKARQNGDRVFYVDFSDLASVRNDPWNNSFEGRRSSSRIAATLRYVLARVDRKRQTRMLLFTDGYSTDDLTGIDKALAEAHVALDYRLVDVSAERDARVESFRVPQRIDPAEPFIVEAAVQGPDEPIPFSLMRDGAVVHEGTVAAGKGLRTIQLTDRLVQPGVHHYELRLGLKDDAITANNLKSAWSEVRGAPRILLVTAYGDDPLITILKSTGIDVAVVVPTSSLSPAMLTGTTAVIINNVSASKLGSDFLGALDFYVREEGRGLLLAGGKDSYGVGGYCKSAIDPLLPVSMELKADDFRQDLAMAIVLDRSGSMSLGVPGGATKMDLADEGAARAVELLGDNDMLTAFAVDSEAHEVFPLLNVGPSRASMNQSLRGVSSAGGGIYVYEGLNAAWEALKKSPSRKRHIILFSDANDSEQPGDYLTLLEEVLRENGTVSVIALGTESDGDANLLKDIAEKGNGHIFFTNDPMTLPTVFAQETTSIARQTFIEEALGVERRAGWYTIGQDLSSWPGEVDGYNVTYLRPDATPVLLGNDKDQSPLFAFWNRGRGRVAAITFPLVGPFSERVRGWASYRDFASSLMRWLQGPAELPGVSVKTRRDGEDIALELLFDKEHEKLLVESEPRVLVSKMLGLESTPTEVQWERLTPGHYRARFGIAEGELLRGVVQFGDRTLSFGPIESQQGNIEWSFVRERVEELRRAAARSGGEERVDLASVWNARGFTGSLSLRPYLLWMIFALVFLELLQVRLGWNLRIPMPSGFPALRLPRWQGQQRAVSPTIPRTADVTQAKPAEPEPPKESADEVAARERRRRFDQAKIHK